MGASDVTMGEHHLQHSKPSNGIRVFRSASVPSVPYIVSARCWHFAAVSGALTESSHVAPAVTDGTHVMASKDERV